MPELPEVETLCRQLRETVKTKRIIQTQIFDPKLAHLESPADRMIRDVRRFGKTIGLLLDDGRCLSIHLRMSGRLFWNVQKECKPHTRWRMIFSEGTVDLVDPRRFATINIEHTHPLRTANDLLHKFDAKIFGARHARRNISVKSLLMDSKAIAGIGNIYACEILHRAGISPKRPASSLGKDQWDTLFRHARRILKTSLDKRGTSISDWRDLFDHPGENQHALKVYGREGKTCPMCGGRIVRIKQSGRSTYYCAKCQQ